MFFKIEPVISGTVLMFVKTQGLIYTVNGRSAVIDGQSLLVALKMKLVVPTGSVTVASTVIKRPIISTVK